LFLIISGFLIHLGYLSNKDKFNTKTFYSKRFWRIYPPYLLALLFFCLFAYGIQGILTAKGQTDFWLHIFFLHNLSSQTFFGAGNGSFWSLALEMQLYFIYPLLLMLRNYIGIKRSFSVILGLSVFLLFIGMLPPYHLNDILPYNISVFKCWFVWCSGALLAENYFNNERTFPKWRLLLFLISIAFILAARTYLYLSFFTIYFITIAIAIFVEWFLTDNAINMNSYWVKPLSLIGICSYSIYLIHQPFLGTMLGYLSRFQKKLYLLPIKIAIIFIFIFLVSYILYYFIELPSIKLGNRLRNLTKQKAL
ncbi:MAG TPA: acyltransferase, partial [Ferruginibacter sp.]|nr:acyltransferase [Ferruginibacter sp.]